MIAMRCPLVTSRNNCHAAVVRRGSRTGTDGAACALARTRMSVSERGYSVVAWVRSGVSISDCCLRQRLESLVETDCVGIDVSVCYGAEISEAGCGHIRRSVAVTIALGGVICQSQG